MQNTQNRKGYVAFSVTAPATLTKIIDLWLALYPGNPLNGNWREVQIQVDPEASTSLQVRIGDGSLGVTVGGVVQKGVTLAGGPASDTYRCGGINGIPLNMMYVQSVSTPTIINVQLFPM